MPIKTEIEALLDLFQENYSKYVLGFMEDVYKRQAWSGAAYNEEEQKEKVDDRVYVLNEIGKGELVNQDLSDTKENNKVVKTQLEAVVRLSLIHI